MSSINPMGSYGLTWLTSMFDFFASDEIQVPTDYHSQVFEIKKLLMNDVSGLVDSMLDFYIECALVDYKIETNNDNLNSILDKWLSNINYQSLGKIPTGISAVAKEYFRERWKGSSLCIIKTEWETINKLKLPTKMFVVDGGTVVEKNTNIFEIDKKTYHYQIEKNKTKPIVTNSNQQIFVQKPYSSWFDSYTTPFLIKRGLFENLKTLELLQKKGQSFIAKALEYMLLLKKGTEATALSGKPEFIYSKDDLQGVQKDFSQFISDKKSQKGVSSYITNFDTEIDHLIPEYEKLLTQKLYTPIERRIIAGFGFIEVLEGISSARKDAVLNPKPFIEEVHSGINDFKKIIGDIVQSIFLQNSGNKKYFSEKRYYTITSTPVKPFINEQLRAQIRSCYDRGVISKKTYVEYMSDTNFEYEVVRKKYEKKTKLDETLLPNPVQYSDIFLGQETEKELTETTPPENTPSSKTGPEAKNFNKNSEEEVPIYANISELPEKIKNSMTESLQQTFLSVFNKSVSTDGEEVAFQTANSVIKKISKKNKKGILVSKKDKASKDFLSSCLENNPIDELLKFKKLEILDKQETLLDKLNKED